MSTSFLKKRFVKWSIGIMLFIFVTHPILLWYRLYPCGRNRAGPNDRIVCSYQSVSDKTKYVYVKRFVTTEYFKYPYFHKRKFEFYFLEPSDPYKIQYFKTEKDTIKFDPTSYGRKFDEIPTSISSLDSNKVVLHEFRLKFKNEGLLEDPEPSFLEMLGFGPTIVDDYWICD